MPKGRRCSKERQGERRRKAKLKVGVDIPTPAEVAAFIQNAKGRWRPLVITAAFSGLRGSELRGLSWDDLDLKAGRIHTVPIGPYVVNTLREWEVQQLATGPHNLVLGNKKGNIESHPNIVKRGLWPPQIAAGIVDDSGKAKYPGLHSLRHFYASWCINRREDGGLGLLPKVVQDRMGHSTLAMTMDTYGHLFPSTDDTEALAAAEQALLSNVYG